MSHKVAIWAFADTVPHQEIIKQLSSGVRDVAWDVDLDSAYIALRVVHGVTFATILATGREPGTGVNRNTIHHGLFGIEGAVAFLGHDDQNGVMLFDSFGSTRLFLLSDGYGAQAEDDADNADNAVVRGMGQAFGWTHGTGYLAVCQEQQGYDTASGELTDIPPDAVPLVAFWPTDDDFRLAGLEPRCY